MTQRTDRIDQILRQEIGQALEREVSDPRIGFVTVTDVETARDLSRAKVWVSIIGSAEERKETLSALRKAMPFIRHGLNSKIRLRRIPELDVRLDDSMERGTRVLQILSELEDGRSPDGVGRPNESLPTPVARFRQEGDTEEEPTAAETAVEPRSKRTADRSPKPAPDRSRRGDRAGWKGTRDAAAKSAAAEGSEASGGGVVPHIALPAYAAAVPGEVVERLLRARCVLTICHENPEADALGSALAVAMLVEAHGGAATPVCADPMPPMYKFLPGMDRFRQEPDPTLDYDLLVVGDCGELERIGPVLESHRALFERVQILDIDHHLSNRRFGAVDWIDANSSATCEMVTLLAWRLGVPLVAGDGMLASALTAGSVMDTANFQHPNTTPRTLTVAAALREAGAPLSEIARRLYRTKPNTQLVLFGRVLARMESDCDGRVVWSTLELADLAAAGAGPEQSEGMIDWLSQAEHAEVAILFKEADGATRMSVRTRPGGVDATVLTGTFGGGGHARAAGATVALPFAEARPIVLARAVELATAVER